MAKEEWSEEESRDVFARMEGQRQGQTRDLFSDLK